MLRTSRHNKTSSFHHHANVSSVCSRHVDFQRGFAKGKFLDTNHDDAELTSRDLQLVREIETQAIQSQQQISLVRSQIAGKQREKRLAQLTQSEISSLSTDTPIYEGVGKM